MYSMHKLHRTMYKNIHTKNFLLGEDIELLFTGTIEYGILLVVCNFEGCSTYTFQTIDILISLLFAFFVQILENLKAYIFACY